MKSGSKGAELVSKAHSPSFAVPKGPKSGFGGGVKMAPWAHPPGTTCPQGPKMEAHAFIGRGPTRIINIQKEIRLPFGFKGVPFPDEFPSLFVQIYIINTQRKYGFHFGFKGASLSQTSSLLYLFKFT